MSSPKGGVVAAALAAVLAGLVAGGGCGRSLHRGQPPSGGAAGAATGSGGGASGSNTGVAGAGGQGDSAGNGGALACTGGETVTGKRLVRLTQHQMLTSIRGLLGDEVASAIALEIQLPDDRHRAFPPLSDPREGTVIHDGTWGTADQVAQRAARAVLDGFSTVTTCSDAPSVDCGRGFLLDFAARAYRRPLSEDERQSLSVVFDETRAALGNVKEAVQFGVNAVLEAPEFMYRSELGADGQTAGTLTPHELASELSFFLTEGPPDQALLDAAAGGRLVTDADVAAQVNRLLASEGARNNLEVAMWSYFGVDSLDNLVVDPQRDPSLTPFVDEAGRRSMRGETTRFLRDTLWGGTIADLLTSGRSRVDATLARLYTVNFPPPGAVLDSEGFAAVDLPGGRAGLLTQAAVLLARARPDRGAIVARGLMIRAAILCGANLPTEPDPGASPTPATGTARQNADARIADAGCRSCHAEIDPLGIPLDRFDLVGRYRTVDELGRPIVTSTTLPALAGGATVADAPALLRELVKGDRFVSCLAQNLFLYALADPGRADPVPVGSCVNRAVVDPLLGAGVTGAGQPKFAELVRGIATSPALRARRAGSAP